MSNADLPDDIMRVLREALRHELGPPSKLSPGRPKKGEEGGGIRALAERAGIAHTAVARFHSGERGLSFEYAQKLASALGYELKLTIRKR
jgi:transcriptional regulator with XRE-family HTH domain